MDSEKSIKFKEIPRLKIQSRKTQKSSDLTNKPVLTKKFSPRTSSASFFPRFIDKLKNIPQISSNLYRNSQISYNQLLYAAKPSQNFFNIEKLKRTSYSSNSSIFSKLNNRIIVQDIKFQNICHPPRTASKKSSVIKGPTKTSFSPKLGTLDLLIKNNK